MGPADEQPPANSRGNRSGGSSLQLSGRNGNFNWEVEYFHQDLEKNELLRTCEKLKDHRVEIAAFFESHPDREERGNFIKGFFDNTFIEQILSNGQRTGYRAYDDMFHMWRGSYLSREREVYMQWWSVASRIEGMILMDTWLDADEKPLPTEEEQKRIIYHADSKDGPGFDIPQAAIDYVLMRGSSFSQGKLRIFEQFQKNETKEANINFLKQEYGTGGYSDPIPGSGLWEDHDAKGIRLHRFSSQNKAENAEFIMKWPMVEKRIRELIAADRYLSPKEKEAYPQYLRDTELRRQRHALVDEFRSIIYDYNDFWEQVGDKEKKFDLYRMSGIWSSFGAGEKSARYAEGEVFTLPVMRQAMELIIGENTHHADRARAMLEKLSGEITRPFEPTYDELNPPPPKPKEYKLSLGDTLYIGVQQYELEELLSDAIQNIHAEITEYDLDEVLDGEEDLSIPALPDVRNFSYAVVEGKVYYRENSRMNPVDVSATAESRIKGLIAIRDSVRQLIEYQTEDFPESFIAAEQTKLNNLYDEFSKKYGLINSRANTSAFSADSSYCLLASLEILDDEGNFVRKADMFTKRTIRQAAIDKFNEAFGITETERHHLDLVKTS